MRRLDALAAALAARPGLPTTIFMHHPPFDIAGAGDPFQFARRRATDDVPTVVARYPQVIRICCGHAHRTRTAWVGGAVASTMPSVGVDLRQKDAPGAVAD